MRYLLDTHTFLWWITDDPRLSGCVRTISAGEASELWFSAASAWEIAIKARLGTLRFVGDPTLLVTQQIAANAIRHLPIDVRHALQVYNLPPLHRDPFDRMLVAQAMVEDLPILSDAAAIEGYDIQVTW